MLIEDSLKVDIFWSLVHYISSIVYSVLYNDHVDEKMDIMEKILV